MTTGKLDSIKADYKET